MRVLMSPYPCQHLLLCLFYFSDSNGCEVVSHCGANIFSTKCPQRISVLFSHSQYDECQPFYGVVSCIADRMEERVGNMDKVQKKTAKRFGMARVLPWMNNVLNFYTFINIKWPNHSQRPFKAASYFAVVWHFLCLMYFRRRKSVLIVKYNFFKMVNFACEEPFVTTVLFE